VEAFEAKGEGAFQAYLRQAMLNRIRNELRRFHRKPDATDLSSQHPADQPSPLEAAIGRQAMERYDTALMTLKPEDRELVIAKLEMCYDYDELAAAFGRPSVAAARKAVQRATIRLVQAMRQQETGDH
jgi:RNA polymerase sigma-70 factor (ECF subfamily)